MGKGSWQHDDRMLTELHPIHTTVDKKTRTILKRLGGLIGRPPSGNPLGVRGVIRIVLAEILPEIEHQISGNKSRFSGPDGTDELKSLLNEIKGGSRG